VSRVGTPAYEATVELAEKLGRDVVELPGGHLGFVSHPAAFARELVQPLARTGRRSKWRRSRYDDLRTM